MLMELGYRLAIEESPFIQQIRNNVIFVFTPTTEVDGHDRQVDNQRAQQANQPTPSMVYWGKYVAHDNNRDGIGKGLKLSQNVLAAFLDLHPQVLHDLHESVNLLYVSTGTGPYNPIVDPIQVNEWWLLAQNEILEMTKRGVPGVWTYNYYDGWVPELHVLDRRVAQLDRPLLRNAERRRQRQHAAAAQSREWYRPNPNPGRRALELALEREHAAVGAAHHAEQRREEQGNVPRELLREDEEPDQSGQDDGALRLRDSGGSAQEVRHRRPRQHRPPRRRGRQRGVIRRSRPAAST